MRMLDNIMKKVLESIPKKPKDPALGELSFSSLFLNKQK
jgi:hypothetical protein